MKHLLLILSLSPLLISNSFAAEKRDLICHSGPGMFAKYRQTNKNQNITIYFKRQAVSHAKRKVGPGYCAFQQGGIGSHVSNKLYMAKKNARNTLLGLHISPTTVTVDYKAMSQGAGINPQIKVMMELMHRHKRFIVKTEYKKIGGIIGWAWVVESVGWNNTL